MKMKKTKTTAVSIAMLILSMVIFGTIGIFRKMIPMGSGYIALVRGAVGAVLLFAVVAVRGHGRPFGIRGRKFWLLGAAGAFIGLNWMLLFESYNYTTVSVATLCYYMEPTIVVILSVFLFGERMSVKKAVCLVLSLLGMVLVSGVLEGGSLTGDSMKGIAFALGAALLYSAVVLINKKVDGTDPFEKTALELAFAAAVMVPYLFLTGGFKTEAPSFETVMLLILVGVVHTGVAYLLYFASMDGLKAQTVALFSYVDPVSALLLSAVILDEKTGLLGGIGACLILGSAIAPEIEFKKEEKAKRRGA